MATDTSEKGQTMDTTQREDVDGGTETCKHGEPVKWNPYNHVVQCHKCGEVFVPGRAAMPADAVYGFAAWLTTRYAQSGPFSRYDDAAPMAELVKQFCELQGWEVGPNYPNTFLMPPESGIVSE